LRINPCFDSIKGANFGLTVYLNAEVYERAPGPHLASGVQVLVFEGNDKPRVAELGAAVPVSEVTRLALQMTTVSNRYITGGGHDEAKKRGIRIYR
jgi:hypothetical protein